MPQRAAKRKKPRVSVVLSPVEYKQLDEISLVSERSMSWLGRYAVRKLLQEYEEKQLPLNFKMPKE